MKAHVIAIAGLGVVAAVWTTANVFSNELSGGPVSGIVVDEKSRQPIAGATVIARWVLFFQGHSSWEACYHVELAVTDSSGRYTISKWSSNVKESDPPLFRDVMSWWNGSKFVHVYAYAPGYPIGWARPRKVGTRDIVMTGEGVAPEGRITDWTNWANNKSHCLHGSALKPALRRIYNEALRISETDAQRKQAERILYHSEAVEVGYDEAQRRSLARRR
jgi:hypothetical protein